MPLCLEARAALLSPPSAPCRMKPTLALVLLAGCDAFSNSEPEYRRVAGRLAVGDSLAPTISAPNAVRPGESVSVTVTTEGSTCEKESDTEVSFVDGAVEIRPYDLTKVLKADDACGLLLQSFPHTVSVTFPAAGPAIVRAVGAPDGNGRPVTRELGIVVR